MSDLKYLKNVVTLELDADKCIGCRMCISVCPHGVFEIRDEKAVILDRDTCMECGACARNCPADAIKVQSGVGCATAVIQAAIKGTKSTCNCGSDTDQSCC